MTSVSCGPPPTDPPRSDESIAFQEMWMALRRPGVLVPTRADFQPRFAKPFLKGVVLTETSPEGDTPVRVRLVGSAFERRMQTNIKGADYFDHLPESHHDAARENIRAMFAQPCGMWQIMPFHYRRRYAELIEITALPLAADGDRPAVIISFLKPLQRATIAEPTGGKAFRVETVTHFQFLDVGAGLPALVRP